MKDTQARREELVRTMNRTPKNAHEAGRRAQACKRLQDEINELMHAGDK